MLLLPLLRVVPKPLHRMPQVLSLVILKMHCATHSHRCPRQIAEPTQDSRKSLAGTCCHAFLQLAVLPF